MIAALLIAVAGLVGATPSPPVSVPEAITVTGARLKRLRIVTKKDRRTGITRCVFKQRSGDPALDAGVCAAVLSCVTQVATAAEIRPCMDPAMRALVPKTPWHAQPARGAG